MQLLKFRIQLLVILLLGIMTDVYGQLGRNIALRWDNNGQVVNGDFVMVGNFRKNIRGGGFSLIDAGAGVTNKPTQSCTAATLKIASPSSCLKVKWAGLYWGSSIDVSRQADAAKRKVKLKLPGENTFRDITADEEMSAVFAGHEYIYNCYANVTNLIQGLGTNFNNQEYFVGDIWSDDAKGGWGGWSLIVVYEDAQQAISKRVYVYDGCELNFQNYAGRQIKNIPITGFQTPPAPAGVNARIGLFVGAGNINSTDYLKINGVQQGQSVLPNRKDDFMDGSVSFNHSSAAMPRRPEFPDGTGAVDIDIFDIPNPNNTVIKNGDTSLNITFEADDAYITFAVPFSVDAIAPVIEIEKMLKGTDPVSGNRVNFHNKEVTIGTELTYEMRIRNTGNDDAKRAQFEDIFPNNVEFIAATKVPAGATLLSGYPKDTIVNGLTRKKVIYKLDDALLVKGGGWTSPFEFKVKASANCTSLRDVCTNVVDNQAFVKYKSDLELKNQALNPLNIAIFRTAGSFPEADTCRTESYPTSFLIVDTACNAPMEVFLCGTSVTLTAGSGYDSYQWRKQGSTTVLGTGQSLSVDSQGTYVVTKTLANNKCKNGLTETFVVRYDTNLSANPLLQYVAKRDVEVCGNDGKAYVQIPLCGDGTSKTFNLTSNYPAGTPIKWYKFTGTRPSTLPPTCPQPMTNANKTQWQLLHTGAEYTVNAEGEYAVEVTFNSGLDACSQLYYFRVTKSSYNYTVVGNDVFKIGTSICKNGAINLSGITGNNQQYQILKGTSTIQGWTDIPAGGSVSFTNITEAGEYKVFVREKVAPPLVQENVCSYEKKVTIGSINLPDQIVVTSDDVKCSATSKYTGHIRVVVSNNVYAPFTVAVRNTTTNTLATTYNNIYDSNTNATQAATLSSLPAGTYQITLTAGGCSTSVQKVIDELPALEAMNVSADIIACADPDTRVINVVVRGGKPYPSVDYQFSVYHGTGFTNQVAATNVSAIKLSTQNVTIGGKTFPQISYQLRVVDPWASTLTQKDYRIQIVDANNCNIHKEVTVKKAEKPKFTVATEPADCNLTAGKITATLTNPALTSQYTIAYSIRKKKADGTWDSWVAYQNSNVFSGLTTGDYQVRVRYSVGSVVCYYPEDVQLVRDPATGNMVTPNPIPVDQRAIEVTIGDGGGPVKGFVGITKLACSTGPAMGATIRVANVSGGEHVSGSVKYQYKLDGGNWLDDVNIFNNVAPGTHTIQVRGKNQNCVFTKTITIDPPLTNPNITQTVSYDCEGKGHVTFTPDNASYDYSYDQTAPPTNWKTTTAAYTFPTGYSAGSQTLRVYYKSKTHPNPNVLIHEDFGQGANTCSSEIYSAYTCKTDRNIFDGAYLIINPSLGNLPNGCWTTPNDHTGLTEGRYLAMNVGSIGYQKPIYHKVVNDVLPTQPIKYQMFVYNLCHCTTCAPPLFRIQVVNTVTGAVLQYQDSPAIPVNGGNPNAWHEFSGELPATGLTSVRVEIVSMSPQTGGNDLAVDDIYVYQEPESCLDYVEIPVLIDTNKNFDFNATTEVKKDVTCHGANDGSYKIEVANFNTTSGFRYRLLRGTTPHTPTSGYASTTTGTLSFTNLIAGNYRLEIQYDATNTACHKTKDFVITQPAELVVTLSSTANNLFLNCQETSKQVKLSDIVSVQGGSIPYTYTLINTTTGTPVTIDSQGFVLLSAGIHTLKVTDTRNCNTATSTKTVTFEVKQRQAPTMVLTRDNCAVASGTNVKAVVTRATTSASATLTYQIKLSTELAYTTVATNVTSSTHTFNNLPAGTYDVRVIDQYNCSVTGQITVYTPFTATATSTTKQKCATTETPGTVTVTPTGGSGNYSYAYMSTTTPPSPSDYVSSSTKSYPYSTTTDNIYISVKDNDTGCVVVIPRIELKGTPATDFTATVTNPDCAGDSTGKIQINITQGAPTYTVEVLDATSTQLAEYTKTTTTSFVVSNLLAGVYSIKVTDVNGCLVTKTVTITDPQLSGTIQDVNKTPTACNPAQADLGFKINLDPATLTTGYTILYSKDNGATWQTSNEFINIAGGTTVQPAIGRFPNGTTVTSGVPSAAILCKKEMGVYVTKILGGVEVDYSAMTMPSGTCASSYSVPVRIGTGTYHDVAYALDSQTATTWNPATGSQATGYSYTFTGLWPGRQYTIYARYKLSPASTTYCYSSTSVDLTNANVQQPNIKVTPIPVPVCSSTATTGSLRFVLSGGNATSINYQLMKIDPATGVESVVTGDPSMANPTYPYNPALGATIDINSVPLSPTILYFLKIEENTPLGVCVSASSSTKLEYVVASPIIFASPMAVTLHCNTTGATVNVGATGGSNAGFTYKILRNDVTSTPVLRREIRSTTNNLTLYRNDFLPTFLATNPASVTLKVVAIDKLTRCEEETTWVVNFTQAPTFTVSAINNCTLPYSITITPTSGSVGQYMYSVDDGVNYSTGNTLQVPAGFTEGKIRVMDRTTGCVGALTTNNRIVFPAFVASARISAMPTTCTGTATFTIDVESGSGNYRYEVYNSANTLVLNSAFNSTTPDGKVTNHLVSNVPSGDTYRVEIIDINRNATACAKVTINNIVVEAPINPTLVLEKIPATCSTAADGQIIAKLSKATHTQGDYTYTITPAVAASQVVYETATDIGVRFTGLVAGSYTVTVTSKYNCQDTKTESLVAPSVLTGSIVATDTDTEFKCSNPLGENKARLTLTASGGTAPYRFSIDGTSWVEVPLVPPATSVQHTFEITDTGAAQNITYYITDSNNCSPISPTYTLNTKKRITTDINLSLNALMTCTVGELVDIKFSANQQSVNGYNVTVKSAPTGAPAFAPYTILGTSFTIGPSGEYIYSDSVNLPQKAGTYILTITDNDTGCTYTSLPYEVKEIVIPTVTATAQKACSTTATTAQVSIELTFVGNVSAGYTYNVYRGTSTTPVAFGGNSTNTEVIQFAETVPVSDTYRVEITMTANTCKLETSVDVQQANHPLTISGDIIQKISYNCVTGTHNSDGIIEVTSVTGGWGPEYLYALQFSSGVRTAWSTQRRYEGLVPDTYEIIVQDSNGCEATTGTIVLSQPNQLTTTSPIPTTTTPVTCFGGNDGTVKLTGVTGGSGVYSYTLFNNEGQAIRTSRDNVPVSPPTSPATYVPGEVLFENLTAGSYKVRITDELFECNQPLEFTALVGGPAVIRATAAITAYPDCNINGDIQISAAGGTIPYTYQRVDATTNAPIGASNVTGTFTGVIDYTTTGTYKFLITDANGCTEYTNEITVDAVQNLAIRVVSTEDKLKCSGDAAGVIRVSATGGSVDNNFMFELLDNTGASFSPAVTNTTGVFEHLVAGTYRVQVTKGMSCTAATTTDIVIQANPVYTGQPVKTDVTCYGAKNGTYTITTNITGQTLFDGSARKLEYAISPRLDRFTSFNGNVLQITDLEPGVYTIIVQDQNGCRPDVLDGTGVSTGRDVFTFTITEPPVFNVAVTPNSTIHEGCLGASDGEFKLTLSGGKPFTDAVGSYYEYSADNTFATGVQKYYVSGATAANQKIAGLPAGTNTIWVRDENGCAPRQIAVVIDAGVDLQATRKLEYTCNGTNTMSNRVTVSVNPAEIGNVVYYLNSRTATPTNNPVFVFPAVAVGGTPQTYTIYVVSNKNNHHECEQVLTVTIDPIPALTWGTPNVTHILCHGESSGKIVANVTGGSGNYEYSISPNTTTFVTTNTFENLSAGFYHITVRDVDYNCSVTETVQITEPTQLNVKNLTERAITCPGKKEGAITFTPEGGTTHPAGNKYTYTVTSITNPSVLVPQTDISENATTGEVTVINMSSGRYTLRITDENGCYIERVFEIEDAPSLVLSKIDLVYTCGVVNPYGEAPTTSQNSTYAIWVTFPTQDIDKTLMKYLLKDGTGTPLNSGALQTFTRFDSNNVAVIEGLTLPDDDYVMTLYYGTCPQELALPTQVIKVRNYNAMTISDVSVTTENNVIRVNVTGGKDRDVNGNQIPYKVYFNYPKYTQVRDLTTNYNQYTEFAPDASNLNVAYYLQKGDETEWGLDGKEYKKVRVYVEDGQGCGYYIDILKEFFDIEIPNYFTPNGDGMNDLWYPENIQNYPDAVIEIFDRYGRFIAKLKPGEGWNGYYNGKELPSGDYWYIIHVNAADDNRVFKGHFTLYR